MYLAVLDSQTRQVYSLAQTYRLPLKEQALPPALKTQALQMKATHLASVCLHTIQAAGRVQPQRLPTILIAFAASLAAQGLPARGSTGYQTRTLQTRLHTIYTSVYLYQSGMSIMQDLGNKLPLYTRSLTTALVQLQAWSHFRCLSSFQSCVQI